MSRREEQALLYRFRDEERRESIAKALRGMGIKVRALPDDSHGEKVGYLLGLRGYRPAQEPPAAFDFPHEVMLLHNIQGKRLDSVLQAIRDAGIERVRFKAVVTPFNILWTLRRLCETMEKEHGALG